MPRTGSITFYRQHDQVDCGPTCLQIVSKYHGRYYPLNVLRERSFMDRQGISMHGISQAADSVGFRSSGVRVSFDSMNRDAPLPAIAHWNQSHFIVVYRIAGGRVHVADPAHGRVVYSREEFLKGWADGDGCGVLLLLEPTPAFFKEEDGQEARSSAAFLLAYLTPHRRHLFQLLLGMLAGSGITLILPFLTQALVDTGIQLRNPGFVYLLLAAQLTLLMGSFTIEIIKSWILLHVGTRANIAIVSDFLAKMLRLPMRFFDSKHLGDILQRIEDQHRIENLLTSATMNVLFSLFNLMVFSVVLLVYNWWIFLVFAAGSVASVLWITLFLGRRKDIDCRSFEQSASNRSHVIQMVKGLEEIKVAGSEIQTKWRWETLQAKLFKLRIRSLGVTQTQAFGNGLITHLKNVLVTFLAAQSVIDGRMTLGMMLATTYIIGQMDAPVQQLIGFLHTAQDAKLSIDRLKEIQSVRDEEPAGEPKLTVMPDDRSIVLRSVSFSYSGSQSRKVLSDVSMEIPEGRVTAVVGVSGSGKTTLLKLLLKFYDHYEGEIRIGRRSLRELDAGFWRRHCGVVLQDGYVFSDSVARNIALGEDQPDPDRLLHAAELANVMEFVESLPLNFATKIGDEGINLSQGQKQRILLARAIYKNPSYVLLDEATSSLDANNEREIMDRLQEFFRGRTVVIVAHRLSTVRNADRIVMVDKGSIVETGSHVELIGIRSHYYQLVKNQLELGA